MKEGKIYRCKRNWGGYLLGELVVYSRKYTHRDDLDCQIEWFHVNDKEWRCGTCNSELLEETDLTKQEAQFLMML